MSNDWMNSPIGGPLGALSALVFVFGSIWMMNSFEKLGKHFSLRRCSDADLEAQINEAAAQERRWLNLGAMRFSHSTAKYWSDARDEKERLIAERKRRAQAAEQEGRL